MKAKRAEEATIHPDEDATDETELMGTIIAVVLGIISVAWIIVIAPAIFNTLFWKP